MAYLLSIYTTFYWRVQIIEFEKNGHKIERFYMIEWDTDVVTIIIFKEVLTFLSTV